MVRKRSFVKALLILAGCCLWLFAALPAGAQTAGEDSNDEGVEAYTLEQAIDRALSVNPRIQGARSEIDKADSDIALRRGEYFPTLSAQSYIERIGNIRARGQDDPDYLDQQIMGVTVRLSQPLFAGMTIFNAHQKSILDRARIDAWSRQQKHDLALEVRLHFLELHKAREDSKSFRDAVRRLETGVEAAEAFHERRLMPYTEVLQAYVDLAEARQQLSQAENLVETTRVRLNILLGFSVHRDISYLGGLERDDSLSESFQELLDYAYQHRPELEVAQKSVEMAEKDRDIARGRYLPEINATVDYHIRDVDYDEPGEQFGQTIDRDRRNEYWTAGIRLEWRFGLGGQQIHQHSKANHELQRLRYNLEEARNEVTGEIRTYFMNIREAADRIRTMEAAIEHARQGYSRAENRFELRMGTISELLDAQARLSRVEAGYNEAVADYLSNRARLYHAMGRDKRVLAEAKSSESD